MTTPVEGSSAPAAAMLPSLVRTFVPYVVGVLLVATAKLGLEIDEGTATNLAQILVAIAYYAAVRYAETKGNARWGWLLGLAKAPAYSAGSAPSPDSPSEVLVADVTSDTQDDGAGPGGVYPDPVDEGEIDKSNPEAARRVLLVEAGSAVSTEVPGSTEEPRVGRRAYRRRSRRAT